jgi:hypothetical protein
MPGRLFLAWGVSIKEAIMKANVGSTDRIIRFVLGLLLLSTVVLFKGDARWLGLIGLIPVATAVLKSCPIYTVFGLSTCQSAKEG